MRFHALDLGERSFEQQEGCKFHCLMYPPCSGLQPQSIQLVPSAAEQ